MFGCSNKILLRFTDGEADSALQADHGWWSPVIFLNSNIPVPTDRLMRQPIRFSYSADGKSHDYLPNPKPTFLWVGNDGEFIPSETATNLNTADPYMHLEHGKLERIQDSWTYWEDNRPSPSINVPTKMDKPTAERWKREGKGKGRAEGKAERKDQRGERTGRRKGHYGRAGFGIGMGWGYGGGGGERPGNGSAETLEVRDGGKDAAHIGKTRVMIRFRRLADPIRRTMDSTGTTDVPSEAGVGPPGAVAGATIRGEIDMTTNRDIMIQSRRADSPLCEPSTTWAASSAIWYRSSIGVWNATKSIWSAPKSVWTAAKFLSNATQKAVATRMKDIEDSSTPAYELFIVAMRLLKEAKWGACLATEHG
ncbi:hypothetical protein BU17DRAFT_69985 [Hysterangium stoloniferum]|nr:hypothetical protein BU17DRAFT_69985 [Hysterangium stoloniferum]